ncbi:hypothetical protein DBR43_25430 [Pedobacter sp. KBW06]|uniref:hypothetical protein n=1 Tax=Pedobacter sp. KBW06 TaxID=2153359 RepID=UPI000F5A2A0B|nr:hypothetical protein [Pedobacter sp. KBW06]RQO67854.1 hypothetical protein DBR43_25430 [Pedobacter sp. KBW06]
MSRKYNINNLEDLHQQVRLLKAEYRFKGDALVGDSKKYLHQFTIGGFIKKYATPSAFLKIDDKFNISSKVMSLILPLVMNSTFFKGSGLVTKALVGLASGKVGKTLDAEHLSAIFNSVKSWFSKTKKNKETTPAYVDYGIPPDSETY